MYKALEAHLLADCDYCTVYGEYCCILSKHTSKYQFLKHMEEVTKTQHDVEKQLLALQKKEIIQYDVVTDKVYSILFLRIK